MGSCKVVIARIFNWEGRGQWRNLRFEEGAPKAVSSVHVNLNKVERWSNIPKVNAPTKLEFCKIELSECKVKQSLSQMFVFCQCDDSNISNNKVSINH